MKSSLHWTVGYRHRLLALGVMVLSTLTSIALLLIRWMATRRTDYHWLVWDTFLAWVPMWISMLIYVLHMRGSRNRPMLLAMSLAWLLFLPNAPYLLTEFGHLGRRRFDWWWCDLVMTFGFAWNGLMLGLLSLFIMQKVVRDRAGAGWAAAMSVATLALCGFGVALGRFQRFNSWDVIRHPFALAVGIADEFLHPMAYAALFETAILLFGFLLLAYAGLWTLVRLNDDKGMGERVREGVQGNAEFAVQEA